MNTWERFSKEVNSTFIKEFSWNSAKNEVD